MKKVRKYKSSYRDKCEGCKAVIIEGIQVTDKDDSTYIKNYCLKCSKNVILQMLSKIRENSG